MLFIIFYRSSKTFKMRYCTTYLHMKVSKTEPQPRKSAILGVFSELKIVFSKFFVDET